MYCSHLTKLKQGAELGLGHRRPLPATSQNAEMGRLFFLALFQQNGFCNI